ncbi:MAG TPA: cytochrome c [Polyangiaceae bacterium]|nr:cytochrome c [Polyangiaceae bacterium]
MTVPAFPSDGWSRSVQRSLVLGLVLVVAGCGAAGANETEMANARNQASTGALLYERSCQDCHGENGQGTKRGPAILGKKRLTKKFSNAQKLFDYVAEKMPKDNPGSLDIGQYWNLVTFIVATHRKTIPDNRLSESNAPDVKLKD